MTKEKIHPLAAENAKRTDNQKRYERWRCHIQNTGGKFSVEMLRIVKPRTAPLQEKTVSLLNAEIVNNLNSMVEIFFEPGKYDTYPGQPEDVKLIPVAGL